MNPQDQNVKQHTDIKEEKKKGGARNLGRGWIKIKKPQWHEMPREPPHVCLLTRHWQAQRFVALLSLLQAYMPSVLVHLIGAYLVCSCECRCCACQVCKATRSLPLYCDINRAVRKSMCSKIRFGGVGEFYYHLHLWIPISMRNLPLAAAELIDSAVAAQTTALPPLADDDDLPPPLVDDSDSSDDEYFRSTRQERKWQASASQNRGPLTKLNQLKVYLRAKTRLGARQYRYSVARYPPRSTHQGGLVHHSRKRNRAHRAGGGQFKR